MAKRLKIEQALFGYRDGHNLITSSIPLPSATKQFLATVTDSSGSENAKKFETSITGLPVPDADFYALFYTWLAPEMPRPGCVWSHVLFINLSDLAQIQNLNGLRKLFKRPEVASVSREFDQTILFEDVDSTSSEPPDADRTKLVLEMLYGTPELGLVILDCASGPWVEPILSIWSQQWPRLRREFAFSTGSLNDRRLAGVSFDLQIAPVSSERFWRRNGAPTKIIEYAERATQGSREHSETWVEEAQLDLHEPKRKELRQFLFNNGSDIKEPRIAFRELTKFWQRVRTKPELKLLLRDVAMQFPDPMEGVCLKRFVTLADVNDNGKYQQGKIWDLTSFLLSSPHAKSFANVEFDFHRAAAVLWQARREDTVSLLVRLISQEENTKLSAFCSALASLVDKREFLELAKRHPELIPLMIWHNPELATSPEVWHLDGLAQSRVYEALTRQKLKEETWGQIVGGMFIAATDVSVREAIAHAGSFAMPGAFNWLRYPIADDTLPSQSWREALSKPALEYLENHCDLKGSELALCAWCAPAGLTRSKLSADRSDVQNLAGKLSNLPKPFLEPTAFMLLAIGLRGDADSGVLLINECFDFVHHALATKKYSPESWWILCPELPDLGFWRDWDRCEKLRRAVEIFLQNSEFNSRHEQESSVITEKVKTARRETRGSENDREFLD